ncbi:MAG: response regulator [Deltaproteobacteria bacterium]|nr:response regulator [Deltaproteobacteria bacterium]
MNQTILIVDDNLDNVTLLEKVLQKSGYQTIKGYNGKEAVELAHREIPDLILLDIMMPVMDGFTACGIIKGDESTRHIPILMLTAKQEINDKVKGLEIGADDYITKPFHLQELLARIKSRLKLTHEHRQAVSRERRKALDLMVEGVEHEIRNPVVSIGGFARRILDDLPEDDRKKGYAKVILKEAERLERMVKDSVALQGLSDGGKEKLDIHTLLDEALSQTRKLAEERRVAIEKNYDKTLPALPFNHDNMLIAFIQIISNGLEAIDDGGKLTLNTAPDLSVKNSPGLKIEIIDTGHGISAVHLDRIFDPFFTSKMSGAGMGLPLTRKIIDYHHGTITVESKPGQGTCVTVTLPLEEQSFAP